MFGLGFSEIVVILVIALLVFGPKRLPEIARSLGKSMGELRKALDEVKQEVKHFDSEPPTTPSERKHVAISHGDSETTSQVVTRTHPQRFIEEEEVGQATTTKEPSAGESERK